MVARTVEVHADYSQFELWPGVGGHHFDLGDLGLATGEYGESITLITPRHSGRIPVEVRVVGDEPPIDPGWDTVVEWSIHTGGEVRVCGWAGEGAFPVDVPVGIDLRVRYVVIDGQVGEEQSRSLELWDAPPAERYLLQLWPAPPAPGRTIIASSPWSQYWAFGPAATALVAELESVPDPGRLEAVIDRALAAHPDVRTHLRAGDERYQSGVIRYVQELFRVTHLSGAYDDVRNDHEAVRQLIQERAALPMQ